ncbi:MAG TPA: SCO family protein [Agriterribacter sp.]|nr:SCO family protein [Agriterribacter sp.]
MAGVQKNSKTIEGLYLQPMMSKKSFLAIIVAALIPLVSYFLLDYFSSDAVVMPRRYFFDTVQNITKYGKTTPDTVWHKVRDFTLTNQMGKQVSLSDLDGKIIVADFFFTSCPSICPALTRNMKRLQDAFNKTDTIVRFLSFSVDPARDSAERLKKYADKYGINHDTWWLLTGDKDEIYDIAKKEFKANVADTHIDTNFIHTEYFFILDKDRVVRGWYNGRDSIHLSKLADDVVLLMLEKDKKKKRRFF